MLVGGGARRGPCQAKPPSQSLPSSAPHVLAPRPPARPPRPRRSHIFFLSTWLGLAGSACSAGGRGPARSARPVVGRPPAAGLPCWHISRLCQPAPNASQQPRCTAQAPRCALGPMCTPPNAAHLVAAVALAKPHALAHGGALGRRQRLDLGVLGVGGAEDHAVGLDAPHVARLQVGHNHHGAALRAGGGGRRCGCRGVQARGGSCSRRAGSGWPRIPHPAVATAAALRNVASPCPAPAHQPPGQRPQSRRPT